MKIALATPIYPPEIGGPVAYVEELCKRISERHEITVVAYTDVKTPIKNTRLISVSKRQPLPIRLTKFFLKIYQVSKKVDVIYVQNPMAAGLPVYLATLITQKPFVVKFVGDEAWERARQNRRTEKTLEEFLKNPEGGIRTGLMMWVQKIVLNKASIVTTPSSYLRDEIIKTYKVPAERVVVNYNASERPLILPFPPQKKRHQILTIARLVTWKGVDGLIKALSVVKERFSDTTLIVAGDGPELENLRNLSKQLKLEDSIKFLGNVSKAEIWQLCMNSNVFVLNSAYEGLPHVILESFAAELPVIATNISGTNEVVYHEKTGLLVDPGNPESLAKAIERIFNNDTLAKSLSQNALKLLEEKFSWKAHLTKLESILKSVLPKPRNKF